MVCAFARGDIPQYSECKDGRGRPGVLSEPYEKELADMVMGSQQHRSSRNASEEFKGEAMMQPDPIIDAAGIAQRKMTRASANIASPPDLVTM